MAVSDSISMPERELFPAHTRASLKVLYAGLLSGLGLVALLLFLTFSLTPEIIGAHYNAPVVLSDVHPPLHAQAPASADHIGLTGRI